LYSAVEEFEETHDRVLFLVIQQLESLLAPRSAQDAVWWARVRNSYKFERGNGALLGDSEFNDRHLLFLYFYVDGQRITIVDWEAGRRNVTSVGIYYRGPARFRP